MRSPRDHLRYIIEKLHLNSSEIGDVLDADRDKIHQWLSFGEYPTDEEFIKIKRLSNLCIDIDLLGIIRPGEFVKRPIFEGRSLLDKFKDNKYASFNEELLVLKILSNKEAMNRVINRRSYDDSIKLYEE